MRSYLNKNKKFQKNSKKIQKKLKKHRYGIISSQKRLQMAEKEKKEEKSFRSVFTQPGIKICKKFQKTKKYHCGYFYSQNK